MEYYKNILCFPAHNYYHEYSEGYGKGDIVEEHFVSYGAYQKQASRGTINVVRNGKGEGNYALIEFNSIPSKYRKLIEKKYPDPAKEAKQKPFIDNIRTDAKAVDFFVNYQLADGRGLPEDVQRAYSNDAAIINRIKDKLQEMTIYRRARSSRVSKIGFFGTVVAAISKPEFYDRFKHTLIAPLKENEDGEIEIFPISAKQFERRFNRYNELGYEGLISRKWCNTNTVKITEDAGEWLWTRFASNIEKVTVAQLHEEYNERAEREGWKKVKDASTIHNYLHQSDVKEKWFASRYGELKYQNKYTRQHRTILPTMRDSLWYSDGTKLNYYYQDENGKMCTCQVYEVMDVYSENLLGYHISKSEDFEAQYNAFKMAIKTSGYKPYEMKYDNQGGHKKLTNSNFLTKLSHLSIPTQPYNARSKTIESAFGRFQSQYLHKEWYFTGQNIQAKKDESKANMEFILANKSNLPTLAEVKERYLLRRNQWNASKHYATGISRSEMYRLSKNPDTQEVGILDMIDLFWMTTDRPSAYTGAGIEIQVKNVKYAYEVLDGDENPDQDFLRANIDRKFFVKYDPTDMSMVRLYEEDAQGNLRYVVTAQTYIKVHRGKQEQLAGEAEFIKAQEIAQKAHRLDNQERTETMLEKHGLHPSQHGLNMPKPKGISKKVRERMDIGQYTKKQSNMVPVGDDDTDIYQDM